MAMIHAHSEKSSVQNHATVHCNDDDELKCEPANIVYFVANKGRGVENKSQNGAKHCCRSGAVIHSKVTRAHRFTRLLTTTNKTLSTHLRNSWLLLGIPSRTINLGSHARGLNAICADHPSTKHKQ